MSTPTSVRRKSLTRETITRAADVDYTHKKQTGGAGQFARIDLLFEPGKPGSGAQFENTIRGGSVPREFIPSVEKGILGVAAGGLLAGFPLIDFKVSLRDGASHDVDSSAMAFEIAARAAFREVAARAAIKLLEPIMRVEVVTAEEYMGDVIGDLNSRRGHLTGTERRGNATVLNAMVPLANMFGYVNTLRSITQGRAQYSMHFDITNKCRRRCPTKFGQSSRRADGEDKWRRRSLSGRSRTATSARSAMSIMARRL